MAIDRIEGVERERLLPVASKIDGEAQTFVICAIGLALTTGPVGFELGAFETVVFTRLYGGWFTVTAALVAFILLPKEKLPFPKNRLFFLAVPTGWMLLRLLFPLHGASDAAFPLLFVLGLVSYVLCLPYALCLIVTFVKPELMELSNPRLKLSLVIVFFLFLGFGYLFGSNHPLLLSCDDFSIAGSFIPENCTPP